MQASSKRTVQVNVKMSVEDFEMLKRAADALWPHALLTNSSIVLGLAKLGSAQAKPSGSAENTPGMNACSTLFGPAFATDPQMFARTVAPAACGKGLCYLNWSANDCRDWS